MIKTSKPPFSYLTLIFPMICLLLKVFDKFHFAVSIFIFFLNNFFLFSYCCLLSPRLLIVEKGPNYKKIQNIKKINHATTRALMHVTKM